MPTIRTAVALMALMCSASVLATYVKHTNRPTPRAAAIQLESAVPTQFGVWRLEPGQSTQVVNPQTQQLLDKLYGQVLTRTYVNDRGYRVMLSVVYGADQRGSLQAHKPEVCYVAQGFNLLSNERTEISTPYGLIAARRVSTQLGSRLEPVTYWFTMGNQAVQGRFERRMAELKAGLTGEIPDGLLFRISSIDGEPQRAYGEQDRFVSELLSAVATSDRIRLSGLAAPLSREF